MTSYDQPRGSRETYEKLSDPAMYWTQVNGEPIREPVRQSGEETVVQPAHEQSAPPAYDESKHSWDEREPTYDDRDAYREEEVDAATRFGGVNWGAGFFGWVVTAGIAALLTGVAGAAVTVLGRTVEVIPATMEGDPRTTALVAAATLLAVLMVAYYAGGYVAGRMSRFDGGKQGAGVWVTGLMLSTLAAGAGLVLVGEYDVLDRIDLPSAPVPADALGVAGLVAVVVALICSLLAAIGGGKVGCRYHRKVDEYL
jgi:hypothetical protein